MSRNILTNTKGKITSIVFKIVVALTLILVMLLLFACGNALPPNRGTVSIEQEGEEMVGKVIKSDEEWRQILTPSNTRTI